MDDTSLRQGQPAPRVRRPRDGEESIEVRRYLDAVRRGEWLIAALVVLATVTAVICLAAAGELQAPSSIVKQVATGPYDPVNVDSINASSRRSSGCW